MRISDWSSDVCSSDLLVTGRYRGQHFAARRTCLFCQGQRDRPHDDAGVQHAADMRVVSIEAAAIGDVQIGRMLRVKPLSREQHMRVSWSCNLLDIGTRPRSEEHTSELQSLMRISYAVFCLKKKNQKKKIHRNKSQIN